MEERKLAVGEDVATEGENKAKRESDREPKAQGGLAGGAEAGGRRNVAGPSRAVRC